MTPDAVAREVARRVVARALAENLPYRLARAENPHDPADPTVANVAHEIVRELDRLGLVGLVEPAPLPDPEPPSCGTTVPI